MNSVPLFREDCPCKKKCERHGKCQVCHAYHWAGKGRLYCLRNAARDGFRFRSVNFQTRADLA